MNKEEVTKKLRELKLKLHRIASEVDELEMCIKATLDYK